MEDAVKNSILSIVKGLATEVANWKEQKIDQNLLIEIQINDETIGPLSKLQLKATLGQYPDIDFAPLKVRPYSLLFGEGEFIEIYNHSYFQRRRPQLVPQTRGPSESQYWALMDGQKHGPYPTESLQSELDAKKILYTDLISFDQGQTWCKVYEYQGLDRRSKNLPAKPVENNTLLKAQDEVTKSIQTATNDSHTNSGIMALMAFIGGNNKRANVKDEEKTSSTVEAPLTPKLEKIPEDSFIKTILENHFKKIAVVFSVIILLIIAVNKKSTNPKEEMTPLAPIVEDTDNPKRHLPGPVHSKSSSTVNEDNNSKELEDVKPQRSFRRSRPFRSIASEEDNQNGPDRSPADVTSNQDNGDDPVEQDDIREKLSKETVDPIPADEVAPPPEPVSSDE